MVIAEAIIVTGSAHVYVDTATPGTCTVALGYTRDGVRIREDGYFIDVKTDKAGGEESIPADIQVLATSHLLSMELTYYNIEIAEKFSIPTRGATPGTFNTALVGALAFSAGHCWQVKILCLNDANGSALMSRYYQRVIFREAREQNKGTKYTTLRLEAVAYPDVNGVLYTYPTS